LKGKDLERALKQEWKMKLSKILGIIGLTLWIILGSIIYENSYNTEIVLTWAVTFGILIILNASLYFKNQEDKNGDK
jgi:hypothetical protein